MESEDIVYEKVKISEVLILNVKLYIKILLITLFVR